MPSIWLCGFIDEEKSRSYSSRQGRSAGPTGGVRRRARAGRRALGQLPTARPAPPHPFLRGFSCLSCSPELLNLEISAVLGGGQTEALGGDRGSGGRRTRLTERAQSQGIAFQARSHPIGGCRLAGWLARTMGGAQQEGWGLACTRPSAQHHTSLFFSRKSPRPRPPALVPGEAFRRSYGALAAHTWLDVGILCRYFSPLPPPTTPQPGKCWWRWGFGV